MSSSPNTALHSPRLEVSPRRLVSTEDRWRLRNLVATIPHEHHQSLATRSTREATGDTSLTSPRVTDLAAEPASVERDEATFLEEGEDRVGRLAMTRLVSVPHDHRVKAVQVGPRPLVILPESRHQSEVDDAVLLRELSQAPVRELEVKGEPVLLVQFPLQLRVDLLSVGKGDQDKGGATPFHLARELQEQLLSDFPGLFPARRRLRQIDVEVRELIKSGRPCLRRRMRLLEPTLPDPLAQQVRPVPDQAGEIRMPLDRDERATQHRHLFLVVVQGGTVQDQLAMLVEGEG